MKYFMIGGDTREYGPVDAELVKQWIREGRANGDTLLRAEGEAEWKPLRSFTDFQTPGAPPPIPAAAPPPIPGAPPLFTNEANDVPVGVGHPFARAWHLVNEHFGTIGGATLIVWLLVGAMANIPAVGGMLAMLFYGPLLAGLFMVFLKLIREGVASPSDVFTSTRDNAGQLVVTGLVTALLTQLAVLCFCLPAIYLQVAWVFSLPLVADRGMNFWEAMELSRRTATRHWFALFALFILAFLPFVVFNSYTLTREINDVIPYVKKVFVAMQDMVTSGNPSDAEVKKIMTEVEGIQRGYTSWHLISQFLLLISLPFGVGSLAFVYEDLFGRKK